MQPYGFVHLFIETTKGVSNCCVWLTEERRTHSNGGHTVMTECEVEMIAVALANWAIPTDHILGVAFYGSWARGTARPDSDLDIILIADRSRGQAALAWLSDPNVPTVANCEQYSCPGGERYVVGLAGGIELELVALGLIGFLQSDVRRQLTSGKRWLTMKPKLRLALPASERP